MNMESVEMQVELEALITERKAMELANMVRIENNEAVAYGEEAFIGLSKEMFALIGK